MFFSGINSLVHDLYFPISVVPGVFNDISMAVAYMLAM